MYCVRSARALSSFAQRFTASGGNRLRRLTAGFFASYSVQRRAFDFPVLGVAAWARFDAQGRVAETRLVLGAVGSYPKPSPEAAALLIGQTLTDDIIDKTAVAAARPAKPLDNTDFTIGWRKDMVPVFVRRAIQEAWGARA